MNGGEPTLSQQQLQQAQQQQKQQQQQQQQHLQQLQQTQQQQNHQHLQSLARQQQQLPVQRPQLQQVVSHNFFGSDDSLNNTTSERMSDGYHRNQLVSFAGFPPMNPDSRPASLPPYQEGFSPMNPNLSASPSLNSLPSLFMNPRLMQYPSDQGLVLRQTESQSPHQNQVDTNYDTFNINPELDSFFDVNFGDFPDAHFMRELRSASIGMIESSFTHEIQQLAGVREDSPGLVPPSDLVPPHDLLEHIDRYVSPEISRKASVGWLKLSAAIRWAIFVRKKAAERRINRVEIEEVD